MDCDWQATQGARKGWFSRHSDGRQLYVRESLQKDAWKGWQALSDGLPVGVYKTDADAKDALTGSPTARLPSLRSARA